MTSTENDVLVTDVVAINAAGNYVPPLYIFPPVRKPELLDGALPCSSYACHPSRVMQMEILFQWFRHFLRAARPGQDHPILLVLDGYSTHTKNLEVPKEEKKTTTIYSASLPTVHIGCSH